MLSPKDLDEIEAKAVDLHLNCSLFIAEARIQAAYDYGRRIKQLVWHQIPDAYCWALSELYVIHHYADGTYHGFYAGIDSVETSFSSLDEAKDACQKHHESIILGALE